MIWRVLSNESIKRVIKLSTLLINLNNVLALCNCVKFYKNKNKIEKPWIPHHMTLIIRAFYTPTPHLPLPCLPTNFRTQIFENFPPNKKTKPESYLSNYVSFTTTGFGLCERKNQKKTCWNTFQTDISIELD